MKKKLRRQVPFLPLILTICIYVVYYPRIACKPDHVSFWFILVLGMSIGVALVRLFRWQNLRRQEEKEKKE